MQRAGWEIGSIERAEINEAFAAIALVVARELGLSEEIVNVDGGAVAHGHPIGATGAALTTKLIHSMRRDGLKRGLVTLCIGGGRASRWRSKRCTEPKRGEAPSGAARGSLWSVETLSRRLQAAGI